MNRELNKIEKRNPKATGAWTVKIGKLKRFFEANKFNTPEKLHVKVGYITNVRNFIETNLGIIENNNGIETFRPYLDRLVEVGVFIQNQKKFNTLREALRHYQPDDDELE